MYWLKRTLSKNPRNPTASTQSNSTQQQHHEQEQHGITEEFINHVKTFTIHTFKNFPLQGFFFLPFPPQIEKNKMLGFIIYGSRFNSPIFIIYANFFTLYVNLIMDCL
jgi:hypothetical protein